MLTVRFGRYGQELDLGTAKVLLLQQRWLRIFGWYGRLYDTPVEFQEFRMIYDITDKVMIYQTTTALLCSLSS